MTENTTETVHLWRDFCTYLAVPSSRLARDIINRPAEVGRRIKDILRVYETNRGLTAENELLKSRQNYWQQIAREDARLREFLTLHRSSPYKIKIARIYFAENLSDQPLAMLDKGTDDSVTAGLPVAAFWHFRLCLVGIVTQSSSRYSKMLFLNNELVQVPVLIRQDAQEFSGLLSGTASGKLRLDYVSTPADNVYGSEVVVSDNSRIYPPGLLVGYVSDVRKSVNRTILSVRPPLDYATLSEGIIIIR